MSHAAEMLLPNELRATACRSDNECGWPPELIPRVIEEGKRLNLLSVGGQLQFVLPVGICECYWVSVDPLNQEPEGLDWESRVGFAAQHSQEQFAALRSRFDFVAEGRRSFGEQFDDFQSAGGDPADRMCFIWYLEAEERT